MPPRYPVEAEVVALEKMAEGEEIVLSITITPPLTERRQPGQGADRRIVRATATI